MSRTSIICALLIGCGAETGFGEKKAPGTVDGTVGGIEIYPADGVNWGTLVVGLPDTEAFRIDSVGEEDLRVNAVDIIDAGENGGVSVFTNLEPYTDDEDFSYPAVIPPGEGLEFVITATLNTAGEATGTIRIRSNDNTIEDPSPGELRVPLSASTAEEGGGDDTGS